MVKQQFKHYVILLEHFAQDEKCNPTAAHTVYGTDGPVEGEGPLFAAPMLYQSRRRQRIGFSKNHDDYAPLALLHAGAPTGCSLVAHKGEAVKGEVWLIYDAPAH